MRILFLSAWDPFPPTNGSELRIHNLVGALADRHEVTLLALSEKDDPNPDGQIPENIRMREFKRRRYRPLGIKALAGFISPVPRALIDTYVPAMENAIREELESQNYDLVVASELRMSAYLPVYGGVPSLLEDLEIGVYFSKQANAKTVLGRWRHKLSWFKLSSYLRRIGPQFSAITVVSDTERGLLETVLPRYAGIEIIPNGVDVSSYNGVQDLKWESPTLIYCGSMTYFANFDAMEWFVNEVFPLTRRKFSNIRLLITGDPGDEQLSQMDGVELTGFVDDVRPLVASADVSIVPLRLGGGTRLKVLEAMALGSPVVSTSKGAEGLEVKNGEHLLIRDDPAGFAQAIETLIEERVLRRSLIANAEKLVAEKYDWSAILPRFVEVSESAAQQAVEAAGSWVADPELP